MTGPLTSMVLAVWLVYRPGVMVPDRKPLATRIGFRRPAASVKALVKDILAAAAWLPRYTEPLISGVGIPCEVPGSRPTSPVISVAPVLVVALPARIAKLLAAPKFIGVWTGGGWVFAVVKSQS